MAKFDGIRMQDLVQVKDPDEEGGLTLVFKDDRLLKIKVVDGKLVSKSIPEWLLSYKFFKSKNYFFLRK